MTALDRLIQRARIRAARQHLRGCGRIVDVGAHEGELFSALGSSVTRGFGIEPLATRTTRSGCYEIHPGYFPDTAPSETDAWDAIVMLAVLEHIPRGSQPAVAQTCHALLRIGGKVIVTVPSPAVDRILDLLRALRLIDGMSLEEHYGFVPAETERIFSPPSFSLTHRSRFQCGLNNLYVFAKTGPGIPPQRERANPGRGIDL